jgi:5-dehydro-2-deoxygluconokinase
MTAQSIEPEVLTVGRLSVDLYCDELGAGWNDPGRFVKSIGGTAANVAVAAARLGRRSALFSKVGADPFGGYVRQKLQRFGVDDQFVGTHPTLRTALAFAVLDPPEDPQLLFYREPMAPDLTLTVDDIELDVVRTVPLLWVTGTGVSVEPSRATQLALLAARQRRAHTVLDLDYRPMFWSSVEDARSHIGPLLDHVTVAVGNRTECEVALGTSDPREAAKRMLDRGVHLAIVKQGADGVLVATPNDIVVVPPTPITVYCGLGAGDAFGGALCHGLLSGWEPVRIVEYANAAGAIVAARLLCSDAMPGVVEIESFLATGEVPEEPAHDA